MKSLFVLFALCFAVAYSDNLAANGCKALWGTWSFISQGAVGRFVFTKHCNVAMYTVNDECARRRDNATRLYSTPGACTDCFRVDYWPNEKDTARGNEFFLSVETDSTGKNSWACEVLILGSQIQCYAPNTNVALTSFTLIFRSSEEDFDLKVADHKKDEMLGEEGEGDWLAECVATRYAGDRR